MPLKTAPQRSGLRLPLFFCLTTLLGLQGALHAADPEPGLLFHVSGEHGTRAELSAGGTPEPTFDEEVSRVADGAIGSALRCGNLQRLAWRAPGNIYSQRGTLSFFWRPRDPVGPTEFPVFRVAFADNTSWDMAWLRIDYNGHGFDAFVTDGSLARLRVSTTLSPFPKPETWTHLSLAWDETTGIRFYINGKLAAKVDQAAFLNVALDQFGPHSRIISPHNVQSDYNFVRGGDIDEIRIYDRMLEAEQVAALAKGARPVLAAATPPARVLSDARWAAEWALRFGWEQEAPPALPAADTLVRKVEVLEAHDLKRWFWKACDGIRETTWPGVYNRSRLPGRNDYFQLPDWDCYVDSGTVLSLTPPDEDWNQVEIAGAAFGRLETNSASPRLLQERPAGHEKTAVRLTSLQRGESIRFVNTEKETPIEEIELLKVLPGSAPAGSASLSYTLSAAAGDTDPSLPPLRQFVQDRFPPDERNFLVARPAGSLQNLGSEPSRQPGALPIVHVLIPNHSGAAALDEIKGGLDGIELSLPALDLPATHAGLIPLNIQVKDPLWPMRNLLDFTFSVKPGEAHRLWLDLRDRILPPGKALYLSIASASPGFSGDRLTGASLRLVFKPFQEARAEHEADRFTQARDSYAFLVEEHPHNLRYNLWNRFEADIRDLMRVNPEHVPGRNYFAVGVTGEHLKSPMPPTPAGIPDWAFLQVELLSRTKAFANWYIEHRQVEFGDFGGGISDDTDLLNLWPGIALMGCDPDKLTLSLRRLLDAAFRNGMFTNGLSTIQADELHSYEEGINCLGENLIVSPASPQQLERAMDTMRGVTGITGINAAGHRHIRTSYYSGSKMSTDGVWGWSKSYSYLVLQPGQLLVDFNGNPGARKTLLELADGLLAHRKKTGNGGHVLPAAIEFSTDKTGTSQRSYLPWSVFWTAWQWTGKRSYLDPLFDGGAATLLSLNPNVLDTLDLRKEWAPRILAGEKGGPLEKRNEKADRGSARSNRYRASSDAHFLWQIDGKKSHLVGLYTQLIEECAMLEYINTEGSLWIDRVGIPTNELQRERLGGVALARNSLFPGNLVGWRFPAPATERSLAVLIPDGTPEHFTVVAYNLETAPVEALLTGFHISPGQWELVQGVDTNDNDKADGETHSSLVDFALGETLRLRFPPRVTSILRFTLKKAATPYHQRFDLGVEPRDLSLENGTLKVTVHSLGSVPSKPAELLVTNDAEQRLASVTVPVLEAPLDLHPRIRTLSIRLPEAADTRGLRVEIDPAHKLEEISHANNSATLGASF
jgi:hypothetical protein